MGESVNVYYEGLLIGLGKVNGKEKVKLMVMDG